MDRLAGLNEDIYKLAVPICNEAGLEIFELNVRSHGGTVDIQILVDHPTGGVVIEECISLNHRLDKGLYDDLGMGDTYTLEVSSPGLDHPLLNYRNLRRVVGRKVHLFLKEPVMGQSEVVGVLTGARENDMIVQVGDRELRVAMDSLIKGKQVIM